jgi:hypothetical protein
MNVELEGPLNADAIYSNVNDLIRLYNCLAPLPLLDNGILPFSLYSCLRFFVSWKEAYPPQIPSLKSPLISIALSGSRGHGVQ